MTLIIAPLDNVWHKFLAFKTGIGHSVPEVSKIISFFSTLSYSLLKIA